MEHSRTEPVTEKRFLSSVKFGLWLSWQELSGRRTIFFINLALIALLVSLAVTVDFMGRARLSSVQHKIDYMGPSLSIVPKGIRSSDLVRAQLKGKAYADKVYRDIIQDMSHLLRDSEKRLIMNVSVEKRKSPVIGIAFKDVNTYPFSQFSLSGDEVLIGAIIASKLQRQKGDEILINSRMFTVAGIIETAGGIDDLSVFMSLSVLQAITGKEGLINETRLYPRSAASFEELKKMLNKNYMQIDVVDSYRGEVAEKDIDTTLGNYQLVIYGAAFTLIALCIIIGTYLNIEGRKSEISTIYTLGATKGIIFLVLTFRAVWIALMGSVIGQLLALFITLLQDYHASLNNIWSWKSFAFVVFGTLILGLSVTTPFTIYSVFRRNLVSHL
jgi:ABC-type lipoprotein release transport system permease subunit